MATMAEEMSEQNPPELPEDLPSEIQEPIENHFAQPFSRISLGRARDDLLNPVESCDVVMFFMRSALLALMVWGFERN